MEFRNIQNTILIINQLEMKSLQVGVKEELSLGRSTEGA
jgi:hypothetical protein